MNEAQTDCLSNPRFWGDLVAWCYGEWRSGFPTKLANRDMLAAMAAKSDAYEQVLQLPESRTLDPVTVMGTRFRWRCLKKFEKLRDASYELKAIEGFLQRNASAYVPIPEHYRREQCRVLARVLGDAPRLELGRFGPGAVAEKLNQAERWEQISWFNHDVRYPYPLNYVSDAPYGMGVARLCAVPKDWSKDRLITVEPVQNTWRQHAIRRTVLKRLHCTVPMTALDQGYVDAPIKQREYALLGSIDGRYDTWDLSNASDGIKADHVYSVFPSWLSVWLEQARTPALLHGKREIPLTIYAGMGNATTFIVQTLYFWSLCVAVANYHRVGKYHVSVFGDDIVLDSRLSALIADLHVFEQVGLSVNQSKTMRGPGNPYRESCGIFALNGHDVSVPKISGYDSSDAADQFGFYGLVNTLARARFPQAHVLAEKLVRLFDMVVYPTQGGLCVNLPWDNGLPGDRTGYRRPPLRRNRLTGVVEAHVKVLQAQSIVRPADRLEYLYYCLSHIQSVCPSSDPYDFDRSHLSGPIPARVAGPGLNQPEVPLHVTRKVRSPNDSECQLEVLFPTREVKLHNSWQN